MADAADGALERLAAAVPDAVLEVCRALRAAGHEAVAVGGAVRDALLGRSPGDWDVATSAPPDAVMRVFRRTIPTGVQHGTVTVLVGRGEARQSVEVTTYRGEGAYSDARHPDQVVFGVALEEDLARRDFVVNAMAWDPIDRRLIDPFGGRDDLAARRLRAVGEPARRFGEDGLRIVRALRFVAVLDLALDGDTQAAIPGALPSLAKVSRERVRVELWKLLGAPAAGRALRLADATGILAQVLPELGDVAAARAAAIDRVAAAPADAGLRTAALLLEAAPGAVDRALRRLTFSNADRERIVGLVRAAAGLRGGGGDEAAAASDLELRRALAVVGRAAADDLASLVSPAAERLRAIAAAGDPLVVGDLALTGPEVIAALGVAPGPVVGRALRFLLERVLADPARNRRGELERLLRDEFRDA